MAAASRFLVVFLSLLITLFLPSSVFAQTCKTYTFPSSHKIVYSACSDLPYLSAFLHWTYDNSSNTAHIAYRHTNLASNTWVAWAVHPTALQMPGCQAFVAYLRSDGSMRVYKAPVAGYDTTLQEGDLSFQVSNLSATNSDNTITIFASFQVPNNLTTLNQLWQQGPVRNNAPLVHSMTSPHQDTKSTVDLLSGVTIQTNSGNSKQRKRNIHGVLNTVSWGMMMPIGALIARYLKVSKSGDPAWFYLHVGCQSSAYIIGIAGWVLGIQLGSASPGIEYTVHRNIGMTLFAFGLLQVLALFLRPNKEHKYREYWNYYHHGIGYAVIILSIINIRKGMNILEPKQMWKTLYIIFVVVWACIFISLEVLTWIIRRKRSQQGDMNIGMGNGGYTANRPQSYA